MSGHDEPSHLLFTASQRSGLPTRPTKPGTAKDLDTAHASRARLLVPVPLDLSVQDLTAVHLFILIPVFPDRLLILFRLHQLF